MKKLNSELMQITRWEKTKAGSRYGIEATLDFVPLGAVPLLLALPAEMRSPSPTRAVGAEILSYKQGVGCALIARLI